MDLRQRIGAHDLKTPAGFPRGSAPGLIPALLRAAATSVVAPRRHRSTRSSPRTSRAGSSGVTRRSGPCRATSRRSSAAISRAASLCFSLRPCPLHGPGPGVCDRVHHRPGADPEDHHTSWRTARVASAFACSRPAHRLGRARAGPLSIGQSSKRRIDELPGIDIHSL
jgi:hypothetical protein